MPSRSNSPLLGLASLCTIVFLNFLFLTPSGAQPTVDIGLFKSGNDTLEVRLLPDANFNQVVSNVVFTIRWDTSLCVQLGNVIQTFPENVYVPVAKSGPERDNGTRRYQVFAGFGFFQMSAFGAAWASNTEVLLMKIPVIGGADSFRITNDAFTASISVNGDFFVSLNGQPRTGIIYQPAQFVCMLDYSSSITHNVCNGDSTGSVDLTVTSCNTPFTYLWSNGETTQDVSGLGAGTYCVTITDSKSCIDSACFTITEPPAISVSPTTTQVSCNGFTDGSIDLTVSGGTPPYSFTWSNAATTEDLSGLVAGQYCVTITDSVNCLDSVCITVSQPAAINLSGSKSDVSCNGGNDGSIDVTVSGGTSPFSYLWSNGDTTQDVSGLVAGVFSLTVTDANNCTATSSATSTVKDARQATGRS